MEYFSMADIIPLIGLPYPPSGHSSYNIPCPCCDDKPRGRHLNINLKKNVFRCPRCGFSGGVFDLYAYYAGIPRERVWEALHARFNIPGEVKKTASKIVIKEVPECPLTDIDTRNNTYKALLEKLSLAPDHLENLHNRGLTDDAIKTLGYKTTPVCGMTSIAKQLIEEGHYLSGVPGFYKLNSGEWSLIQGSRGILIPSRNLDGKIQGLHIRLDCITKRKFRWLSSVGKLEGCKAEGWTHIVGPVRPQILLVEGFMKADIIHCLTGQTVVAVPGVNTLVHLEELLQTLKNLGVEKIMTVFDMDFLAKPSVQSGYRELTNTIEKIGIRYGTYLWEPFYNGLDDYVWEFLIRPLQEVTL